MTCNFTLEHYKETLELAKREGYKFQAFKDYYKGDGKVILLRHDIDFRLDQAERFAEIESGLGIKATYFVRLHAEYNPNGFHNLQTLARISGMGHEIGLHYSPIFDMKRDKQVLETMLNAKIRSYSLHEPNTNSKSGHVCIANDAYSDKFFRKMKYISDSSGRWREGCLCRWVKKGELKLQVLTHPVWWYDETSLENY